jgi:hypothetical protein
MMSIGEIAVSNGSRDAEIALRAAGRPTGRATHRPSDRPGHCLLSAVCAPPDSEECVCVAECGALRRFKSMSRDVRWAVA